MSSIPKPARRKKLSPDPCDEYLQTWKQLFNEIDPDIKAFTITEPEFPGYYNFGFNPSRLSDSYNVDTQLYISLRGPWYHILNGNICCCLRDTSFAVGWIYEFDENLDTFRHGPISWKEMYSRVTGIVKEYRKRIPVPPTEEEMKEK